MTNEPKFTIGFNKLYMQQKAKIKGVVFAGEKMDAFFCQNEQGMRVIVGKWRKTGPHRSCGHWHGGDLLLDAYFTKWFHSREEGNEYFRRLKRDNQVILG